MRKKSSCPLHLNLFFILFIQFRIPIFFPCSIIRSQKNLNTIFFFVLHLNILSYFKMKCHVSCTEIRFDSINDKRSDIVFFLPSTGSVSVLPTVLYLLLGVLREAVKGSVGAESGQLVPGILQALRTVLTSPMSRAEKSRGAWTELLQSALHTLLESWSTGNSLCLIHHTLSLHVLSMFEI